jgi:hypothetical protein
MQHTQKEGKQKDKHECIIVLDNSKFIGRNCLTFIETTSSLQILQ